MKIRTRRQLAVGGLVTSALVVAGLVSALPASAAITSLSPNSDFNDNSASSVTVTTDSTTSVYTSQSTATLTRSGVAADQVQGTETAPAGPSQGRATFTFDLTGAGGGTYDPTAPATKSTDGPANPGVYDLTVSDNKPGASSSDTCSKCFTVLTRGKLALTSLSVTSVAAGGASNETLTGTGFARGTVIAVINPADQSVDSTIDANAAPLDSSGKPMLTKITSNTQLQRRFVVSASSVPGPRDVRVTNVAGTTATCTGCFTVLGAPLTSVSPTGGNNAPTFTNPTGGAYQSITFNGTNLNAGQPSLVFVGNGGSASKPSLTIPAVAGTVTYSGTQISAQYDLRNAAPGDQAYQPVVTDGTTTNACSCRYSVLQPNAALVNNHGMDSDPNTPGDQNAQKQGDTLTYAVTGSNFSRGVKLVASGQGVTNTAVTFTDDQHITATFTVDANAAPGPRDITALTTDGKSGAACAQCLTVVAANPSPSASSSASPSGSGTPAPSVSGSASPGPSTANGTYAALQAPVRVLDSRPDTNVGTSPGLKRGAVTLDLSGQITDAGATTAVLNVTVFGPSAPGFVVVYPYGTSKPFTSNVNYLTKQVQANEVIAKMDPSSKKVVLDVENSETYLIVDLVGYFTTSNVTGAGRVTDITPARAYDKMTTSAVEVDLSGKIPANATSAILNVTGTGLTKDAAHVVVYPSGTSNPGTSNMNFVHNQTQANEAFTKVGTGSNAGKVIMTLSQGSARLIIDVVGYVAPDGQQVFTPLDTPQRLMDSRDGTGTSATRKTQSNPAIVQLPTSIPANASAVVLNVTATGADPKGAAGFIVAYPNGTAMPPTSNVNWIYGGTQANEVTAAVGTDREVVLSVGGSQVGNGVHIVVDITGYLTGGPVPGASASPSVSTSGSVSPQPSGSATARPSGSASPSPSGGGGPCIPGVTC